MKLECIVVLLCTVLHVAYPQPGLPTNFSVQFMKDTRPDFLLHAVFHFSWTPPSGQLHMDFIIYDDVVVFPMHSLKVCCLIDWSLCHSPDKALLSGYELVVELVPPPTDGFLRGEHNCSSVQDSLSVDLQSVIIL